MLVMDVLQIDKVGLEDINCIGIIKRLGDRGHSDSFIYAISSLYFVDAVDESIQFFKMSNTINNQ